MRTESPGGRGTPSTEVYMYIMRTNERNVGRNAEGTPQHKVDGPNKGFNWTVTGRTEGGGAGPIWLEETDHAICQKSATT